MVPAFGEREELSHGLRGLSNVITGAEEELR